VGQISIVPHSSPFSGGFALVRVEIITYYYDPDIPQTLASSRKDQKYGAGGIGVPG